MDYLLPYFDSYVDDDTRCELAWFEGIGGAQYSILVEVEKVAVCPYNSCKIKII